MSPQTRILYNDLPSAVNEIVLEVYRHLKYISWFSILSLISMKVLCPPRRKLFQNIAGSQYNEDDPLSTSIKRTVHWTPKCKVYFFNKLLSICWQCINLQNHLLVSPDIFFNYEGVCQFFLPGDDARLADFSSLSQIRRIPACACHATFYSGCRSWKRKGRRATRMAGKGGG